MTMMKSRRKTSQLGRKRKTNKKTSWIAALVMVFAITLGSVTTAQVPPPPEGAKEELNKLATWLNENPQIKGEIAGHTDKSGLEELNELLSEQRAEAVYEYLLSKKVNPNQISFEGYGSSHPITSNKYQHGKERNRRIAFKLLKPEEQ